MAYKRKTNRGGNKPGAGAPFGNYYAEKFKTPELRAQVFEKAVQHLSQGFSKQSFPPCDWQTLESMMEVYKSEFATEKVLEALREGFLVWEKIGMAGAAGKTAHFSAASWIFNMKNRMGWKDSMELTGDNFVFKFGKEFGDNQFVDGRAKKAYDKRLQAKKAKAAQKKK